MQGQATPLECEEGSAPAGYSFVSVIVVFAVLALLQLGYALHVRALSTDAAGEGARRAALVGATDAEGAERTRVMLAGAGIAAHVTPSRGWYAGREVVVMTVTTALPVLGPWGPPRGLTVTGRAVREQP